jgi:hypothetical protein
MSMRRAVDENRLCDTCGHNTSAPTSFWRVAPVQTRGGLSVFGIQVKYKCIDPNCASESWVASGRQRPPS